MAKIRLDQQVENILPAANGGTGNSAGTATSSNALQSATTTVSVSGATAPISGQVLTATSSTSATWQTPAAGSTAPFVFDGINQGILVTGLLDSDTVNEARTLTSALFRADTVPTGYTQNTSATGAGSKNFGNTAGQERVVILFQDAAVQTFTTMTVRIKKVGSPTDGIRMRFWDNATVGSGSGTAAVAYVPASALTTAYTDVTFRLGTGVSIAATTNRYVSFQRWNGSSETAVDASNYYAIETTTTMNSETALYYQTNSDTNVGTIDSTNEARCSVNGAVTFQILKNDTAGTLTNSIFTNDFEPSISELTSATNGRYLVTATAIDNGSIVAGDSLDIRAYGLPTLSATNVFSSVK